MKPWEDLTESGQIRRLRSLALEALKAYPIELLKLSLVGGFTNVLYRVDTERGPFALRVDLHRDHTDADVDIEVAWLGALEAETDLGVARVVSATSGARYVHATADGVPGARRCVLFHWIPGRTLWSRPTPPGYHALGQLSAGLHRHGRTFDPPHAPMRWDRVFFWSEDVDPVVIFNEDMAHHFEGDRRAILDESIARAESAFSRLDPAEAQVVHGDLHPDNVHVFRGQMTALDFEDVMIASPVQDVATSLFYLRTHPDYPSFREAFEAGYRTVAKWPEAYVGQLEHFWAARTLMFINYVANLNDDPSEYYVTAFERLRTFLDTTP